MMSLPTEYTNTARDFTSRDGDVYTYGRLKKKKQEKKNIQHRPSGIFSCDGLNVNMVRQTVATFTETVYLNV